MSLEDLSVALFQKYFSLEDGIIAITLKNNTVIKGRIAGYFKSESETDQPYYFKWHITNETSCLATDAFGCAEGVYIFQKDISSVFFYTDNNCIQFPSL